MTSAKLQKFVDSLGGIRKTARALDISTDRLYAMLRGTSRIPRHIELACKYLREKTNQAD